MNRNHLLVLGLSLLLAGCDKDHLFDCLKGSGKETTVVRPVARFHAIEMHDKISVEFYRGFRPELSVTGGANLLEGIVTELQGHTLVIRNENKCNWVRDFNKRITVRVYCDSLSVVTNYGSGELVFVDTLRSTDFRYENWEATGHIRFLFDITRFECNVHLGTADIIATGRADISLIYNNSYGSVYLESMQNDITFTTNSGTGDIFLSVKKELYAKIEEAGNIYYFGEPHTIQSTITGSGKLIKQ